MAENSGRGITMPSEKVDLLVQGMAILLFNNPDAIGDSIGSSPDPMKSFIAKAVSAGFQDAVSHSKDLKISFEGNTKGIGDMSNFLTYLSELGQSKQTVGDNNIQVGINKLIGILNAPNTNFPELIDAFNKSFKGAQSLEESSLVALDGLKKIFEIVNSLQSVKIKSIFGAKVKLKLIRTLLVDDVMSVFKSVAEAAKEVNLTKTDENGNVIKVTPEFDILIGFIRSISELGGLKLKSIIMSKFYLGFVRNVLISEILTLFDDIAEITTNPEIYNTIETSNRLFRTLVDIVSFKDLKIKDIMSADSKIMWVASIYEELLTYFAENISITKIDDKFVEESEQNIKNINSIIAAVSNAGQNILLENLATLSLKLSFAQMDINSLDMIVKNDLNSLTLLHKRITTKEIQKIISALTSIANIGKVLSVLSMVKGIFALGLLNQEIKRLKTTVLEVNKIDKIDETKAENLANLVKIINSLNDVNAVLSKAKDLEKIIKTLDSINTIVAHLGTVLSTSNKATIKLLQEQTDGLITVINKYNNIKPEDLTNAKNAAVAFTGLLVLTTLAIVIGASLIGLVDLGDLLTFAATLGSFIYLMSFIYKRFNKESELTMTGVKSFTLLMIASGGIMIAGSLLMSEIDVGALVLFTISLATFMYLLSFPFRRFTKHGSETMIGVLGFTALVVAAGGLLIAAGLLFDELNFVAIIGFAIATAAFLYLLSFPFKKFAGAQGARAMSGALGFSALLVIAGGLLLAGSYLFDMMFHGNSIAEIIKNGAKSILFGIILALYVRFLIWAVTPKRSQIVKATGSVGTIVALIVIAGGLLLAGSYLFDLLFDPSQSKGSKVAAALARLLPGDTEFWEGAVTGFKSLIFNLILYAFIRMLVSAVSISPAKIAGTIVTALAIATLVVVCGGVLLLASSILEGWEDAVKLTIFVVCTLGLVLGIGMLMELLGTIPIVNLLQGALALVVIEALVLGLGFIMGVIVDVANRLNMDAMENFLKSSLYVIGEISLLVTVLAGIMYIPGAPLVLGVGAIALAAILGLAYFLAEMMGALITSADKLEKLHGKDKLDAFFENIYGVLDAFYEVIYGGKKGKHKALVDFASLNPIKNIKIFTAIKTIKDLSIALSEVANCVKQWIDLKIPIYDGMEQTGWITINQAGFKDATDNISNAITSLLAGVLFVADYDAKNGLGLFEYTGLFSGTKIGRMMKGIELLGVGLSSVAEGVKEWIDLKIPVYQGMKQTGWITIDQTGFRKATDNISNAIISLLAAVLAVAEYDKTHELGLFEYDNIFAGTKMGRMMKGIKLLGVGLSSVAEGVKDWIDLKIPVYQGMKQTGWITIGQKEFNDATDHVTNAVVSLLAGVLGVAEYDKTHELGLFQYEGIFAGTKIGRMMKGIKMLGIGLSSVASGVKDWIDLKIPVYEGLEQKGWITITDKEFDTASKNIAKTVKALLIGVAESAKTLKEYGLIGDEGFSMNFTSIGFIPLVNIKYKKSPIKEALHAIGTLGVALAAVGTGLKFWADVKFPTGFDKEGKPTGYLTIADMQKTVPENIKAVIVALGESIADVYKYGEPKGLFDTKEGSPMFVIAASVNLISGALVTVAKAIGAILGGKFQKFDKNGKVIEEIDFSKLLPDLEANRRGDSKFKRRVKTILTSLGEAIGEIYESTETKYIFNSSYNGGKSIGENISVAVSSLVNALTKTLEMLKKLNELDKDNKLSGEIDETKKKLKNIIQAVLGIFTLFGGSEVLDANGKSITLENKGWFGIDLGNMSVAQWMTEEQPNIDSAKDALSSLSTAVVSIFQQAINLQNEYDKNSQVLSKFSPKDSIVKLLTEFLSIITIDKFKEINNSEKKLDIISNVSLKIETLNSDIKTIYEKSANLQKIWNDYGPLLKSLLSVKNKNTSRNTVPTSPYNAVENINNTLSLYNDIITLSIINKLFTSFNSLSKTGKNIFEECKNIISNIITIISDIFTNSRNLEFTLSNIPESKFDINAAVVELLEKYVGILQSIQSVSVEFDSLSKEFNAYNSLLRLSKNINDMTNGVTNAINSYVENFSNIKLNTDNIQVAPVIQNIEGLKSAWINIMNSINDLNNKVGGNDEGGFKFNLFSSGSQFDNLEDLVKVVNKLMDVYDRIESINSETNAFEKIAKGISTLDIVGQKLSGIDNLDKNQKIFEKYVKTLNSINLQKLNTLFNFAAALNKLADRFVSLDGLTDALGNKLTSILQKLITEMKRAEDTIKNADKLRQKRETLIKQSINDMKNIMNQHLVVDIYNQSVNQSLEGNPDVGTPGTPEGGEGGTGAGTGGGADNSSKPMLTPNEQSKSAQNFQRSTVQQTDKLSQQIKSAINSTLTTIFVKQREKEFTLKLDR